MQEVQSNMYLPELVSYEPENTQGQLLQTRCCDNALKVINPDVGDTIKISMKLMVMVTDIVLDPVTTSSKIYELFNLMGVQVKKIVGSLVRAVVLSDTVMFLLEQVLGWLKDTEVLLDKDREHNTVSEKVVQVKDNFYLCRVPGILLRLREEWQMNDLIYIRLETEDGEMLVSPVVFGEEGQQLQEYKRAFQKERIWFKQECVLLGSNLIKKEDMLLGEQMRQVEYLGPITVRLVERCNSQKINVELAIKPTGQRWENVVVKKDRIINFSVVKVEKISTNISQMVISTSASDLEEIMTLSERPSQTSTPLTSILDQWYSKRSMMTSKEVEVTPDSNHNKVAICTYSMTTVSFIPKPVIAIPPNSRNSVAEVKNPPSTLPNSIWCVESVQTSCFFCPPSILVKQLVVTYSGLPSLRSLASPPSALIYRKVITEPFPTRFPIFSGFSLQESYCSCSVLDIVDQQNEMDNAIIYQLLRGPSTVIEDVKANIKVGQSTSAMYKIRHSRNIQQLMETVKNIKSKLVQKRRMSEQLKDLVQMEMQK